MCDELTDSEPEILHPVLDEVHATHVAALLFSLVDPAKRTQGPVARLVRRHASCDIRFDSPLEVVAEFVLEVLLNLIAAEERPKSQWHCVKQAQQAHVYTSFTRTTPGDRSGESCPGGSFPLEHPPAGPVKGSDPTASRLPSVTEGIMSENTFRKRRICAQL